jgi:hypothetical protein
MSPETFQQAMRSLTGVYLSKYKQTLSEAQVEAYYKIMGRYDDLVVEAAIDSALATEAELPMPSVIGAICNRISKLQRMSKDSGVDKGVLRGKPRISLAQLIAKAESQPKELPVDRSTPKRTVVQPDGTRLTYWKDSEGRDWVDLRWN